MKAVLVTKYGTPDVLRVGAVPKPVPKDNEVLVRVMASVVAPPDCAFRKGEPFISRLFTGLVRPKHVPGDVFAGVVEETGKNAGRFSRGDRVYGSSGTRFGTNAGYAALSAGDAMAPMPAGTGFAEAACASEGFLTALPFLRDHGRIRRGMRVLVNGASGGVGVYAVQLARYFGAHVTGVCGPTNRELVLSLGADAVVDYTREDFTAEGAPYDIVFDAVGKSSFPRCAAVLAEGGVYCTTVPSARILLDMLRTGFAGKKRAIMAATGLRKPADKIRDLLFLNELIESGRIRPVIDRIYPLERVAEAHAYVETGHKKGGVALSLEDL